MARQGVRSDWDDVPVSVRAAVDDVLGSAVVVTRGVSGGFSPGPAVRAELEDGRVVFIKAASTALNEQSPGMHRREGVVLGMLPPDIPAPRLLGVLDDGDWVALAIEWIDGRMPVASDPADVQRLLDVLHRVADATEGTELSGFGSFAETHGNLCGHWQLLAADPHPHLDGWSLRHLDRLAELDAVAPAAMAGTCLLHLDVRTDNVLLADSGPEGDLLVDWPGAALGAPWIDLVGLLPALHLDGGPPPEEVFAAAALAGHADTTAVDAFVAALAGYFTRMSLLPPPPGLPTVRAFQAAQGEVARSWIAQRLRLH
jgi:aminoglycoside phosphotransferase (APT) family kinase protein